MRKLLAILLFIGFSIETPATEFNGVTSVFRLKDMGVQNAQSLGHCTGFFHATKNKIFTAGHCYHDMPLAVVDVNGKQLVDLSNNKYEFATDESGPFDLLTVSDLTPDQVQVLKRLKGPDESESTIQIMGYPANRRSHPLTILNCAPESPLKDSFRVSLESALGIESLVCEPAPNQTGEVVISPEGLKGMSGGYVRLPDGRFGVAYHVLVDRGSGQTLVKIQTLNEGMNFQEADRVWLSFQLDKKFFEQLKIPNRYTIDLDSYLLFENQQTSKYSYNDIQEIILLDEETLMFRFFDGSEFTVKRSTLPRSINQLSELL